jgi:hypothetical protein
MLSHAVLAALWVEQKAFFERMPKQPFSYKDKTFFINGYEYNLKRVPMLSELEYEKPGLLHRVCCSNDLLKLTAVASTETFEDALGLIIIEQELLMTISNAIIEHGVLDYYSGSKKSITLENAPDYDTLSAAYGIRYGYIVSEVQGSHFIIKAPSGLLHSTREHTCTCTVYEELKECHHTKLVRTIIKNRRSFFKHQIIQEQP